MKKPNKKVIIGGIIGFIAVAITATLLVFFTNNQNAEENKIVVTDPEDFPMIVETFDPNGDNDGDNLLNGEEKDLGTDYESFDTDKDGLSDHYEVKMAGTDPTKMDTDKDGLDDGLEIKLSLNPLEVKTDGITPDGELKFDTTYGDNQYNLKVKGDANVHNIYAGKAEYCNLDGVPGVVSDVYEFYMRDMHFDSAELTLSYNTKFGKNVDVNNLAIYQLMDDTSFVEVEGYTVNESDKTISVKLEHFSKYFVGDKSVINQGEPEVQVFLLLDNSGSMYPEELCEGSDENDVDFKRVDFALNLIQMTNENVKYGLAKFTKTYYPLSDGFNSSKEDLTASLNSIKTEEQVFDGTYIATSSIEALKNFSTTNDVRKFVILLTDGETTENLWAWYDEDDLIAKAQEKNVSFIVIGLGSSVDETYLRKIADSTNGMYVYANNPDALEQVYNRLTVALDYNYVDLDEDGTYDHILIADTGFNPEKNGFSFKNYYFQPYYNDEIVGGQCYGMARFCQLYYKGKLLLQGNEVKSHHGGGPLALNAGDIEARSYDLTYDEFFTGDSDFASNKVDLFEYESLLTKIDELAKLGRQRDKDNEERLVYSDEFHEFAAEYPNVIEFFDLEVPKKNQQVYFSDGKEYRYYEQYSISVPEDLSVLTEKEKSHYNFFMALHNMYTHQFASEGDVDYLDVETFLTSDIGNNIENFDLLVDLLQSGIPVILGSSGHAVNAIGLYRNLENPNEYKLMLYDNNRPGKVSYVDILKAETAFWDIAIESLTNKYEYFVYDSDNVFNKRKEISPVRFYYSSQLDVEQ